MPCMGAIFLPPRPAQAALQQELFLEDLLVEIEALAVLNQPGRLIESALPPLRRPYAQGGIVAGNLLFLRGFTAQDRQGDLVGRGDMRAQTEQTFANMAVVLQEAGGSLADLVQTHVTLTDWHAYQDYNEVYNRHVREPFPTRATWQGGLGREGLLIEIESVAALGVPGSRLTLPYRSLDGPSYSVGDVIYAEQLAPGRAAYAQAVRVGDLVFVSDQQGVGPGTPGRAWRYRQSRPGRPGQSADDPATVRSQSGGCGENHRDADRLASLRRITTSMRGFFRHRARRAQPFAPALHGQAP